MAEEFLQPAQSCEAAQAPESTTAPAVEVISLCDAIVACKMLNVLLE